MKRIVSLVLCAALSVSLLLTLSACGGETLTLNVYNWGEYISDGSEDSLDTIAAFESWYQEEYGQKIRVNYDTYPSNEDMYAKLSSGAVSSTPASVSARLDASIFCASMNRLPSGSRRPSLCTP